MAKNHHKDHGAQASDDVNAAVGEVEVDLSNTTAPEGKAAEGKAESKLPRSLVATHVVRMLGDKEGKVYGKDNNPKRPSSKAAARFVLYRDGMTVEEALKEGLQAGDLTNDSSKGFIKLEPSTAAA